MDKRILWLSRRIFVLAAATILVTGCAPRQIALPNEPPFYRSMVPNGAEVDGASAASMISLYRRNNGLGPLILDPALSAIAKDHARAMARANKVGHDLGNGNLDARAARAGYQYERINENIAAGYHTLAEAFSGWRESPHHRRNMLSPPATRMGIAVAQLPGSKYKVFWALVLAEPEKPKGTVVSGGSGLLPVPLAGMLVR
jgi:uncharacterized protein YkwD